MSIRDEAAAALIEAGWTEELIVHGVPTPETDVLLDALAEAGFRIVRARRKRRKA